MKISNREREVIYLISHEYQVKEIAELLYITRNTVKTHKRTIMQKLGVRNSASLVRKAFENGLLPLGKFNFINYKIPNRA